MKLEKRYIVLKIKDVLSTLTPKQQDDLDRMCFQINLNRESRGRSPVDSLVIEKDWPEYEPTLKLLSERVDKTNI